MNLIQKYFPDLEERQRNQLEELESLYGDWNSKINLISRKDIDHLYERHVLYSMAIAKYVDFTPETRVMDLGTGGGFPGIPLAIMFPDSQFTLVDSTRKKIGAVKAIARSLGLDNVIALHARGEEIRGWFEFITVRAVKPMPQLVEWCRSKITSEQMNEIENGLICLKGGDVADEMRKFDHHTIVELSSYFEEEFFETKKLIHLPI